MLESISLDQPTCLLLEPRGGDFTSLGLSFFCQMCISIVPTPQDYHEIEGN